MSPPTDTPEMDTWCAALPLLQTLTYWRRASGYDPDAEGAADVRSSGESNAALAQTKHQLAELGVDYHWCAACQEYHLRLSTAPT